MLSSFLSSLAFSQSSNLLRRRCCHHFPVVSYVTQPQPLPPIYFYVGNLIMEDNESCTILLQLSEDDPFFDKKKQILHARGFSISEQLELQYSSYCPDSVASNLEKLLQVARIIYLDEVELYFNDFDGSRPVEFYSTRNEVEALNAILSLINQAPIKAQVFRDAINDRITKECGEKSLVGSIVTRNRDCVSQENRLVEWGESNGVKTSLEIALIEGAGRGAIVKRDLGIGDIALEIPVSLIISEELVCQSAMFKILERIEGISAETMMLLWSMKERHNCYSKFRVYFDTLPKAFNTGLSFGVSAMMALDGTTLLEEIMQAKEHLRVQYEELVPALCSNYPGTFPSETYTWENFLWACELWYSNSMKIMFADGKLRTCLVPIAGFLNHSLYPHITHYGKVDSATNTLKFPLSRPCLAGEQCCLSYGNLSSSHLITFYGFSPQGDNPYNVIPIDIDAGKADCYDDSPWTTHMVRGTWFSNNHGIFHYGLPTPLLNYLRKARDHMPNTTTIKKEDMEVDIEVLEDLVTTFNSMMENLGDTTSDYGEDCERWDIKLAVEFKEGQRRIISSILSSCDDGIRLLQTHLQKCTS
ncbi:unnamed protein product [Linum tenue]|uniref:Rubisco LSMT substrate-binding domain-containing protein n=1 Tax=Linum tenue TaxID=586396 RepID=A0AAV0L3E9_9ROSI|nr:unnamed protein product [Linum tenue]